jgi:hypothetical protein
LRGWYNQYVVDPIVAIEELLDEIDRLNIQNKAITDNAIRLLTNGRCERHFSNVKVMGYDALLEMEKRNGCPDCNHENYYELIMAVVDKVCGETRHQTALRLITQTSISDKRETTIEE